HFNPFLKLILALLALHLISFTHISLTVTNLLKLATSHLPQSHATLAFHRDQFSGLFYSPLTYPPLDDLSAVSTYVIIVMPMIPSSIQVSQIMTLVDFIVLLHVLQLYNTGSFHTVS